MAYELYKILEVSPQATPEEIKRAYYRLVRKYPPEKYSDKFKEIREAYETLCDPKARRDYDSEQEYGDQILELLNKAEVKWQEEEWSSVISLLKRVLILKPGANSARNRLGICYTGTSQWDAAEKVYQILTRDNPEVPLYWSNFGQVYKQQAESLNDEDDNKAQLYHQARKCFEKAVEFESFNSKHYLDIARTHLSESNYSQALAWAERSIGADGKADFHDFEALLFICIVHLRSGELKNIESTAQRIISLLPDSEDARKYAAYKFYNLGFDLAKAGVKLASIDLLRDAFAFIKAARNFDASDTDIKELYEKIQEMVAALEQYELIKEDYLIINGLQRLAGFCLADAFSLHNSDTEKNNLLDDILSEIIASSASSVISSSKRIKSCYPTVYGLKKDLFDRIEQAAQELNPKETGSPTPSYTRPPVPSSPTVTSTPLTRVSPTPVQTSSTSSDSKDWRNTVIIGSLIGGAILIGFALTRSPQPSGTNKSNPTYSTSSLQVPSLNQEQAANLIKAWIQAKKELFAPPFNRQRAAELITGKLYSETLGSDGSMAWLENNGAYYRYGVQRLDSIEQFFVSGSNATIEVVVTEERILYNRNGSIDRNSTALDTRLVRYSLQAENSQWKIAAYQTIKVIHKS